MNQKFIDANTKRFNAMRNPILRKRAKAIEKLTQVTKDIKEEVLMYNDQLKAIHSAEQTLLGLSETMDSAEPQPTETPNPVELPEKEEEGDDKDDQGDKEGDPLIDITHVIRSESVSPVMENKAAINQNLDWGINLTADTNNNQ